MKTTTDSYLAGLRRMTRAAGPRIGREDPEQLAELIDIRRLLDEAIVVAVAGQRACGITWESIAEATGTTKSAAVQKWATKVETIGRASDTNEGSE